MFCETFHRSLQTPMDIGRWRIPDTINKRKTLTGFLTKQTDTFQTAEQNDKSELDLLDDFRMYLL